VRKVRKMYEEGIGKQGGGEREKKKEDVEKEERSVRRSGRRRLRCKV
jgi:hypothetical protein